MKRVAILFVLAVLVPSLALAWLAVRSLQDQEYLLERQQSLLYQGLVDAIVNEMQAATVELQTSFEQAVDAYLANRSGPDGARRFDQVLRQSWPYAEVGFAVSLEGEVLSPSLFTDAEARQFRLDNDRFLCSTEATEVFYNAAKVNVLNTYQQQAQAAQQQAEPAPRDGSASPQLSPLTQPPPSPSPDPFAQVPAPKRLARKVNPSQQWQEADNASRLVAGTADFRSLVDESDSGMVARFLQDQLKLLFYYRLPQNPELVFGAQIDREKLLQTLRPFLALPTEFMQEICVVLLNEDGRPVFLTHPQFQGQWKRPLVAAELGEFLPHWELAVYLLNPDQLNQSAHTLRLTLGLVIALLVLAILVGGWLVTADVRRHLRLARQKTDFVSNVSHELKTPLTSIRMFGELLAEDRVAEPAKRKRFLRIITAESERLTRLINNVLDFARLERGEKSYDPAPFDLTTLVREVAEMYRPHLESNGFTLQCRLPAAPVPVHADRDAVAQILVNLISNAEKYGGDARTIELELSKTASDRARICVLDRGPGVPEACRERIFEQFYRAHDGLNSGIRGFGLGLTLARQIARAHGGEVRCQPREGGGSRFILELPSRQTDPAPCPSEHLHEGEDSHR